MTRSLEACYVLLDREVDGDGAVTELFESTEHTGSLWGPMQHGGPVAALLTRAMDRLDHVPGTRITRVTVDLLGPVPVAPVRVRAQVDRPGRRISLLSAVMEAAGPDGVRRPVARASAWRLATEPTDDVALRLDPEIVPPAEPDGRGVFGLRLPDTWTIEGFVAALTWNVVDSGGAPDRPALAWLRMDHPLVAGERLTPLERIVAIADTVNGIGAQLDAAEFTYLNTDLTVLLHTPPADGGWVGLAAQNSVGPDGVGANSAVVYDASGPVGHVTQNVLVQRR